MADWLRRGMGALAGLALGLAAAGQASGGEYVSVRDGDWHAPGTWTNPAIGLLPWPESTDIVILFHNLEVTQSVSVAELHIHDGTLELGDGTVFTMEPGRTGWWHRASLSGQGTFANSGRVVVTGEPSFFSMAVYSNLGQTHFVDTPSLQLDGRFNNATQGITTFNARTGMVFTVAGTGTLHNGGTLEFGWGTTCMVEQAKINNHGTFFLWTGAMVRAQGGGTWSNGHLTVATGSSYRLEGGTNWIYGGIQAQGQGNMMITTGKMTFMRSGTTTGTYLNAPGGGFHWGGGTISASVPDGELNVQGTWYVGSSGSTQLLSGMLINHGVVTSLGATGSAFHVAGIFSNAPSGSFVFAGTNSGIKGFGPTEYRNSGRVEFAAEGTTTVGMAYFQRGGTSTFHRGKTSFQWGAMWGGHMAMNGGQWFGGASWYMNGGSMGGSGQIANDVYQNSGRVSPGSSAGRMEIEGTFLQEGAEPELYMEIGGGEPGTGYDQIAATSTGTVSGVLTVELLDGFEPAAGARFDLLTASERTGQFAQTNLPALGDGRFWAVRYLPQAVQLRVATPEDVDGDGLPDEWELDQFEDLETSDGGEDDQDGDGYSDFMERLCGTDPNDSADRLAIEAIESNNETEWIRVRTAAGTRYAVEARESFAEEHGWEHVAEFQGEGGEQAWTNATGKKRGIMRLRVAWP